MGGTIDRTTCNRDAPHDRIENFTLPAEVRSTPREAESPIGPQATSDTSPPFGGLWAAVAVATVDSPVWNTAVAHVVRLCPPEIDQ